MTSISRNPDTIESDEFDIIVVGGGIYGACMLLEASRRGFKTLLIERDDYGGATSFNSLRIIHGGLRYLQSADLGRFRRSVSEQAWWLANFADQIEPLPCLMPLYNRGLRSTHVMRAALKLNDWLATPIRKAHGVEESLASSKVLSAKETTDRFSDVMTDGLRGGAMWFDAKMRSPQRLLIEVLRWAIAAGGSALNYLECTGLLSQGNVVSGVHAKCRVTGREYEFCAKHVVSCAGPWTDDVFQKNSASDSEFSSKHSRSATDHAVAFNIVINCPALSDHALAVTPPIHNGATYFAVPFGAKQIMVGTVHLPPNASGKPSAQHVANFVEELRLAVPSLQVSAEDVVEVMAGRLPPITKGSHLPAKSPTMQSSENPEGLTVVSGVKYTTARFVAEKTLRQICQRTQRNFPNYQNVTRPPSVTRPQLQPDTLPSVQDLQNWMKQESVLQIEDLLLRRCDLVGHAEAQRSLAKRLSHILPSLDKAR